MGEVAETMAIHAAHVAHYPNYVRNHSLGTRITMIDLQAEALSEELIKRYRHLFDNSYYRIIKPSEDNHKYNHKDVEYDVSMPLVQMAKNVNYVYDQCFHHNIENWQGQVLSSAEIDAEKRDRLWADLPNVKRWLSIYNAMTIPSKMCSVGFGEDDWDKFYDISQQYIEIFAQVEHNRWNVEELILM